MNALRIAKVKLAAALVGAVLMVGGGVLAVKLVERELAELGPAAAAPETGARNGPLAACPPPGPCPRPYPQPQPRPQPPRR